MPGKAVFSLLNSDIEPKLTRIEVFSEFQIPSFQIVGLPSTEVSESKERIRAAFSSSGFEFPRRRVVLNLSPANVRKQGTGTDLALALRIWLEAQSGRGCAARNKSFFAWGELGLNGDVRSPGHTLRALKAALASGAEFALFSEEARSDLDRAICLLFESLAKPERDRLSAVKLACISRLDALVRDDLDLHPVSAWVRSESEHLPAKKTTFSRPLPDRLSHYDQRAMIVSLAGRLHSLFIGSKGVGKTTLADCICVLHQALSEPAPLESLWVRELRDPFLMSRADGLHSSVRRIDVHVRPQALTGGTHRDDIIPGEFSLASGGLLLADEFAEWSRDSREVLRSPLETGEVVISRSRNHVVLPARFQMIATANECPCGGSRDSRSSESRARHRCRCTSSERSHYFKRISGPLLDRFGLVARLLPGQPLHPFDSSNTAGLIRGIRAKLRAQWGSLPAEINGPSLDLIFRGRTRFTMTDAGDESSSYRRRHHLMRIALVLAAIDGRGAPCEPHLSEAKSFLAALDDA